MSLTIEVADVKAVLLTDGVWYKVVNRSFEVDAFWFQHNRIPRLTGGESASPVGSAGATWVSEDGARYFCVVDRLVAVRMSAAT